MKNKHKKNKKDKPTANELLAFGGRWERAPRSGEGKVQWVQSIFSYEKASTQRLTRLCRKDTEASLEMFPLTKFGTNLP